MSDWREETFEVKAIPDEGELVQYAAVHILQLRRLNIPIEEVKFFMREKQITQ